jgi:hypothetical protein
MTASPLAPAPPELQTIAHMRTDDIANPPPEVPMREAHLGGLNLGDLAGGLIPPPNRDGV